MKQAEDDKTLEMVLPVDAPKKGRGRPKQEGGALTGAQRQKAHRDRVRASGKDFLTVALPLDVLAALAKYVKFKDTPLDDAVERILRDRLLRKR